MIIPLKGGLPRREYRGIQVEASDARALVTLSWPPVEGEESGPLFRQEVRLESVRTRREFFDGAAFGLTVEGRLISLRGRTLNDREQMFSYALQHRPQFDCLFLVPDTEAPIAEWLILPLCNDEEDLPETWAGTAMSIPDFNAGARDRYMPVLDIRGPDELKEGESGVYETSASLDGRPYPGLLEVYLESVNGFLPKTRVRVSGDAPGAFTLLSHGLEAGDTVKLKAGFRNLPARTEKTVRMI